MSIHRLTQTTGFPPRWVCRNCRQMFDTQAESETFACHEVVAVFTLPIPVNRFQQILELMEALYGKELGARPGTCQSLEIVRNRRANSQVTLNSLVRANMEV